MGEEQTEAVAGETVLGSMRWLLVSSTHCSNAPVAAALPTLHLLRVRFHNIRNVRIENVGKYQSCMVSKLRIIWKQTVAALLLQQLCPWPTEMSVDVHSTT